MKQLIAAAALAALFAVPAQADIIDYAELYGGVTQSPDLAVGGTEFEMDTGFNVGGAFGWNISPAFSVELDFFYTESDFTGFNESVEAFSGMVNGFYNFDVGSSIRPYIGAGVGFVQVKESDHVLGLSDTDTVFGYQGMIGFLTAVDDKIDLIVEYRYQGADDASLSVPTAFDQEYSSHSLSAGFRFNL